MTPALQDLSEYLDQAIGEHVHKQEEICDQLIVWTTEESLVHVMSFLRDDQNALFKVLLDITAVDYPVRPARFEVVYNLLSLKYNMRIRVKLCVDDETAVPSMSRIFHSALWAEREVWDMFGVKFSDHPDLRRILTDYGFEGHPLRKEFPLTGFVEMRYDEEEKRVVYEPVKLTQAFRTFDFESPWEGILTQLPGDEKTSDNDTSS